MGFIPGDFVYSEVSTWIISLTFFNLEVFEEGRKIPTSDYV